MPSSLSHDLPPLSVRGNTIFNRLTGEPVRLRGINISGLEYTSHDGPGSLTKIGLDESRFHTIVNDWRANVVRLPFNQEWVLAAQDGVPNSYLNVLDECIQMAAFRGAYTILDLQWLNAEVLRGHNSNGTPNFVPPLPDADSISVWRKLARRYCHEPAILYDLFNEPHDALPDDDVELFGINAAGSLFPLSSRKVRMDSWQPWARYLIGVIRAENPRALIMVSGIDWGFDLRGFPLQDEHNIIYSSHVYSNKGKGWRSAFGRLAETHPVFIAEWGGTDSDLDWGSTLLEYMDSLGLSWTAWSWFDHPRLVSGDLVTPFGSIVRNSLASTNSC